MASIAPHFAIMASSLTGILYFILTGALDNMFSVCGARFATWKCAGYTTTWILYAIISAVEFVFWANSFGGKESFQGYMAVIGTVGLWGTTLTYWIPIMFWLIAFGADAASPTGTTNFLWEFILSFLLWGSNFCIHYFFIPDIEAWGLEHYQEPGRCICIRCDCAKDNMAC